MIFRKTFVARTTERFRIFEETTQDGSSRFFIKVRTWIFWSKIQRQWPYSPEIKYFNTKGAAENHVKELIADILANSVNGSKCVGKYDV